MTSENDGTVREVFNRPMEMSQMYGTVGERIFGLKSYPSFFSLIFFLLMYIVDINHAIMQNLGARGGRFPCSSQEQSIMFPYSALNV